MGIFIMRPPTFTTAFAIASFIMTSFPSTYGLYIYIYF